MSGLYYPFFKWITTSIAWNTSEKLSGDGRHINDVRVDSLGARGADPNAVENPHKTFDFP